MRIISGSARGRQLASLSGRAIRPTPDRVREALFSALTSRLGDFSGLHVLDLFSGSGALALEALSRGATTATLVDSSPVAARIITDNLERCRFTKRAHLIRSEVSNALEMLARQQERFDLIFLDPPYHLGQIEPSLARIVDLQLLADHGIICAESAADENFSDFKALNLISSRTYGTTQLCLYGWPEDLQ